MPIILRRLPFMMRAMMLFFDAAAAHFHSRAPAIIFFSLLRYAIAFDVAASAMPAMR